MFMKFEDIKIWHRYKVSSESCIATSISDSTWISE